jgi:hypothetical protein
MSYYRCHVCHAESKPVKLEGSPKVPEGWRVTTRGFAGKVTICPECVKLGRNFHGDAP